MIKHLNDWEIAKKTKSNSNIFVKRFPVPTVPCKEDYMKAFLRKPPD